MSEVDDWFAWREKMRQKHRTMTAAEYWAWCRTGDAISHPSSGDAFPGGITIDFGAPPFIGKILMEDEVSEKPHRVQLSRKRGWKMPPNTVKVDRTTMWGNRWKVGTHSNLLGRLIETTAEAVECYRKIMWPEAHHKAWVRENLAGKNLACWCRLDQPCHADVLLEWANNDSHPHANVVG